MNEETFKMRVERLRAVNEVVKGLDEAIKLPAFIILRPYIDGKTTQVAAGSPGGDEPVVQESDVDMGNVEEFVRSKDTGKPADAVKAIAAWWFSEYGSNGITAADVERIAEKIGVTIPERPYMTLKGMRTDGKDVFRVTKGTFIPTRPHGEKFFQTEYGVTKGRNAPPSPEP